MRSQKEMQNKILVVDDVIKNIELLGSVLGRAGYAVSYAMDGAKALEMAFSERFDLILLDVMMPGMDGFEVCRGLKRNPDTEGIPVLFLTAKSEQSDIVRGLEEGAVDYLTKPFNPAELLARVKTHMALQRAKADLERTKAELERNNQDLERLLEENQMALSEIKILRGILPICSSCKKIRDDEGYWTQIESYIQAHSYAEFSHGLCMDCAKKLYPEYADTLEPTDKKRPK
jgi:DNA-binding response OmpR family regulator